MNLCCGNLQPQISEGWFELKTIDQLYCEQPESLRKQIGDLASAGYDGFLAYETLADLFDFVARQPKDSRYICFGTGGVLKSLWETGILNKRVSAFVDNDWSRIGQIIYGLDILSPDSLCDQNGTSIFITSSFEIPIKEQLEGLGFEEGVNVFSLLPLFKSIGWLHHCDLYRLSNFRE